MTGMFATSKAGHDKGNVYFIIREDEEYVYLVDGKIRTLDKPKRKNKKHIQIIKDNSQLTLSKMTTVEFEYDLNDLFQMQGKIEEKEQISNEAIKRAIKEYGRRPV